MRLPPRSPELNPLEHLGDHLRGDSTGNKFFASLDAVVDQFGAALHCLHQHPEAISMPCFNGVNPLSSTVHQYGVATRDRRSKARICKVPDLLRFSSLLTLSNYGTHWDFPYPNFSASVGGRPAATPTAPETTTPPKQSFEIVKPRALSASSKTACAEAKFFSGSRPLPGH